MDGVAVRARNGTGGPAPGAGLRLALGEVVALVGSGPGRRGLVACLVEATTRCAAGHPHGSVQHVRGPLDVVDGLTLGDNLTLRASPVTEGGCGAVPWEALEERVRSVWPRVSDAWDLPAGEVPADVRCEAALALAGLAGPAAVLVDGLVGGLPAGERGEVLRSLRAVAAWPAVVILVEDDVVAADDVAHRVLHVDASGVCTPVG